VDRPAVLAIWAAALCCGCQDIKEIGGGAGIDLPGDFLGVVYECRFTDGSETEFCWADSENELVLSLNDNGFDTVDCYDTPRHAGPCWYRCPGGRGCNSFSGCWCPVEAP
jgi:hypothetical protein